MNIRAKLLIGFAAVLAMNGAVGLYAAVSIGRTSALALELYNGPLMATDFARSARFPASAP